MGIIVTTVNNIDEINLNNLGNIGKFHPSVQSITTQQT